MKFLVDAQLPNKLCKIMAALDVPAEHVIAMPNGDSTTGSDSIKMQIFRN